MKSIYNRGEIEREIGCWKTVEMLIKFFLSDNVPFV